MGSGHTLPKTKPGGFAGRTGILYTVGSNWCHLARSGLEDRGIVKKGYVVVLVDVKDEACYREYAQKATEIEARYGAVPLVVADADEVVEGSWPTERVVILEFPSIDAARAWYSDPDYRAIVPLRHGATVSHMLFAEGFLPD